MKSVGAAAAKKAEAKAETTDAAEETEEAPTGDNNGFFTPNDQIDFSKVKVEPLFEEQVDFDTFSKSDFRAVKVKACEAVKKSKKLLQFTIDDGTGTDRTILSGIAAFYEDPAALIGKRILFVANFEPRKMMGIESQGMILSAVDFDESLSVVTTSKDVKPGSQVG